MRKYDVVVIGAGPGGMTAALYAARANLNVAMLDRGIYGGQMNNTDDIENYPGFTTIKGPELGEKMYQGTVKAGVNFVYGDVRQKQLRQITTAVGDGGIAGQNAFEYFEGIKHRQTVKD